jgi:hypothetical protein
MPFVIILGRAMWKGWDGVEMGMGMGMAASKSEDRSRNFLADAAGKI